jgi:UV DNA damage endonuclease
VAEVTARAAATWDREPLFHLSSPREGWQGAHPAHHHDFIDIRDFPDEWRDLTLTVEIEAKAKEVAIERLRRDLAIG